MLLTDEGCCGVGGASQDYAGFGAMEEGLISREGRDLGVAFQAPPGSQASSRGEAKDSALLSSRDASRRVEEGLSRSLSGGGGKPSFPSPSAGDLRELARVPLRGEGIFMVAPSFSSSALKCWP